ncbi:FAD synthase [Vitis vinifera]|uniref:FAD synthase n=1 Tax=Vitis vinifera TaxID=29760 RepID=A0A438JSK2_VITVI|nr:FAD synthase [Vitis vinifera]
MEIDEAIRESDDRRLKTKYNNAIYVVRRALALYSVFTEQPFGFLNSVEEVALSFNGGKDSTVLLHLLRAGYFLHKREQSHSNGVLTDHEVAFPIRTIYFESPSAFLKSIHLLMKQPLRLPYLQASGYDLTYSLLSSYGLQMDIIRLDFKSGLEALLEAKPIRAIFLGVRIGDPTAVGQEQFSPSSPGWPPFMRVNPILDGLTDGRLERAGRAKKFSLPVCRPAYPAVSNGMISVDSNKNSTLTATVIAQVCTVEDELGPSLCRKLHSIGWSVSQTAVLRNDVDSVAEEVERWKSTNDVLFIYGGVGPLHSDVTLAGVAKAFVFVWYAPDEEFEEYLRHLIGDHCTGDRNEMAQLPEGITELLHHEKLSVPLIKCQNVFILTATNVTELDKEWDCLIELTRSSGLLVEAAQALSKLCFEFPDLYIGPNKTRISRGSIVQEVPSRANL